MKARRRRGRTLSAYSLGGPWKYLGCGCMGRRRLLYVLLLLAPVVLLRLHVVMRSRNPPREGTRTEDGIKRKPRIRGGAGAGSTCFSAVVGSTLPSVALSNIANVYLQPQILVNGKCDGRKVVAFAITLTKDGSHIDGAAVLAISIDDACGDSEFLCDLVAFLHDDIGQQSEAILKRMGFRVMRLGLPLDLSEIEHAATRARIEQGGCCGSAELIKLFAFTLTEYHRVIHLDTDALVLQPLDPILDRRESLLYTTDVNMATDFSPIVPVQGGFLVVRPDVNVFDDVIRVLKTTEFTRGWDGTGVGMFWGGVNVQGLLPYYYEYRAPPGIEYGAVNRCVFNNMADTAACKAISVSTIRSAHFTNCQKPWMCTYPHPKIELCTKLMDIWFSARHLAETSLDLPHVQACTGKGPRTYQAMLMLRDDNTSK